MASEKKSLLRFVQGGLDRVRLGGYGGTVHVEVVADKVRVRVATTRTQETIGPANRANRERALKRAQAVLRRLRENESASEAVAPTASADSRPALVVRDLWVRWLKGRANLPPDALWWGRAALFEYLTKLPPAARGKRPTCDSLNSVLQSARRLHRNGALRFDRPFDTIAFDTLPEYVNEQLDAGASPATLRADLGRFRTAVRYFQRTRKARWGDREDPTAALEEALPKPDKKREIMEHEVEPLLAALREGRSWRAYAAAMIAYHTGRRIGAIGGRRPGLHMDAPPLCADDFQTRADGSVWVTWRANAAKGRGYGGGDVRCPCSPELADLVSWLTERHANPEGPEHPLLWSPQDPRRAVSYESLTKSFAGAWKRAFGLAKPSGLAWHGWCRNTVTTVADRFGPMAAAEFTGRSEKVVLERYKVTREARQQEVAAEIARIRRSGSAGRGTHAGGRK